MPNTLPLAAYLEELKVEAIATRKCLERITENAFDFKPHPTSMAMGYLSLLIAEIPLWIKFTLVEGEIDFATFKHAEPKTTAELLQYFDDNMQAAEQALQHADEAKLQEHFKLKANGQLLFSMPKIDNVSATINHWVHHRGQLTVYMRLKEIAVPSIYGPSADEKTYAGQVQ